MGLIKFIGAGQAHQYWILKVENHWSACKSGPFVKLLLPDQAHICMDSPRYWTSGIYIFATETHLEILNFFLTSLWNSECVCIYIKFNYIHNLLFDIYYIDNLIFNTYSMPSTKTLLSLMDPLGLSLFLLSQSHQFWNNLIRNGKIPLNRLASIRR